MIKTKQKTFQKDKSNNNNISSNSQRILKMESKKLIEQKNSSNPNTIQIKTTKNDKDSKFPRKRTNNSISSKGCTNLNLQRRLRRGKLNTNIIYNNTCGNNNNNNKLLSSNLFLTNDTDIPITDEEKKTIKSKFYKNNNDGEISNLPELDTIFKKNKYKKTIIIDNEGNNNLHLNIKKGENDLKQIFNNNNSIFLNSNVNSNTETNSLFTNKSKMEISNNNIDNKNNIYIIKEDEIKKNIIDDTIINEKNEEEKRIKEYKKLFNLLNTNIEQFKKMFNSNNDNNNDNNKVKNTKEKNIQNIKNTKNKNLIKKNNPKIPLIKRKTQYIPKKKDVRKKSSEKNSLTKLKKNFSEKHLSSSSKALDINQNIFTADVRKDIEKDINSNSRFRLESNNAISSFLESSIQDDFCHSLINRDLINLSLDDKNLKDDIISINIDEKGKDESIQDIQDSRTFKGKNYDEKTNFDKDKNEKKNIDKNNCFIF